MRQSVRLPPKLSQLRKLGTLREEQVVRTEEWEGYKAIEKLLRFDGLYIQVITFTNDPERFNLAAVYIESSKWSISPFRVGESISTALSRMGTKATDPNGAWRFSGESDTMYIESRGSKVYRLVYECYTG